MRFPHRYLAATAFAAFATLTTHQAAAQQGYLDLDPPETRSGMGYGYDSLTRQFVPRKCVQFSPSTVSDKFGRSDQSFTYRAVVSNAQMADALDLSVGAKFSGAMGLASGKASSKARFINESSTSLATNTILASYLKVDPTTYIAGDINLAPEILPLVGTPAFRQQCGDYLIIGEQAGRWLFGTIQLSALTVDATSRFAASGVIDAQYGLVSGQLSGSTLETIRSASTSSDLQIRVLSNGTTTNAVTIDEFLQQVRTFPSTPGPASTYMLKAVPFSRIVANWPTGGALTPESPLEKVNVLADAAWSLVTLLEDTQFIVRNSHLYALGTSETKRQERKSFITERRSFYQAELADLRKRGVSCDTEWTSVCDTLLKKWQGFETFVAAEYGRLPVRYVSDCYAPRDVSSQMAQNLKRDMAPLRGQFAHEKGDREVGGGPVDFKAYLTFSPDASDGNVLGARKLVGLLDVGVEEDKSDHTTFRSQLRSAVFDLSSPDFSLGQARSLNQCSYRGRGVTAPLVSPFANIPATCESLRQLGMPYATCVAQLEAQKYHGILRQLTGSDPRTVTFNRNPKGVLWQMRCTVDSSSGNDTSAIGCSDIALATVNLDLHNSQDVVAEGWKKPATSTSAAVSGQPVSPTYATLIGSLRANPAKVGNGAATASPQLRR